MIRYLDRHAYVDDPADIAHLYVLHGTFWTDLPVAISGPLQLLTLLPALRSTRSRCAAPLHVSSCTGLLLLRLTPAPALLPGLVQCSGAALLVHTFILLRGLRLIKLLLLSREV